MNLTVVSSLKQSTGYGRHGVKLVAALRQAGVDVQHCGPGQEPQRIDQHILFLTLPSMVDGWHSGQTKHLLSMVEGSQVFDEWRPMLAQFDTVIVPSVHNVLAFRQWHPNVKLAMEGIDPAEWFPIKRQPVTTEFRFHTAGTGLRKGGDIVAEAFRRAFPVLAPGRPVPKLCFRAWKIDHPLPAAATVISTELNAEEERDFYADAHCWVQPSRGEGFGLMPLQAIAQGCPTILTAAHGHLAYCHLGIGVPAREVKAGYFMFGDAGNWWEPDVDAVAAAMRDVYDNYPRHLHRAQAAARVAGKGWGWDEAAKEVLEALGGPQALAQPYRGDGSPVKSMTPRFPVRVLRPWQAEVADTRYHFEPGVDYWECADLKRVLAAAGALDPSCLNEGGLDDRLIEVASASTVACPTCQRPMNQVA